MATIRTNNQPRKALHWWDLSEKEQHEFDYLVPEDYWESAEHTYDDAPEASFFRYKGKVYDLGEFEPLGKVMCLHFPEFKKWDSYQSDTCFSGVLVKDSEDFETVVVGSYRS